MEPRGAVDANHITVAHQRDRATSGSLGADMADHHAPRCTGEAPIGDEAPFRLAPWP